MAARPFTRLDYRATNALERTQSARPRAFFVDWQRPTQRRRDTCRQYLYRAPSRLEPDACRSPNRSMLSNRMSAGLDTTQLLEALTAFKKGDFSVRLPLDWTGVAGKVADTFNEVIELNERMASELARFGRVVGREGRINQRAALGRSQRRLGRVDRLRQRAGRATWCIRPAKLPASSAPWPRAICRKRWRWKSMTGRCKANSCAPPRPSTGWSISSARSPRK